MFRGLHLLSQLVFLSVTFSKSSCPRKFKFATQCEVYSVISSPISVSQFYLKSNATVKETGVCIAQSSVPVSHVLES